MTELADSKDMCDSCIVRFATVSTEFGRYCETCWNDPDTLLRARHAFTRIDKAVRGISRDLAILGTMLGV